jgi:hypothetical protein
MGDVTLRIAIGSAPAQSGAAAGRDHRQVRLIVKALPSVPPGGAERFEAAYRLLKSGVAPSRLSEALRRAAAGLPEAPAYCDTLRLCDRGVVLGKGTVIAALEDRLGGRAGLAIAGQEERILALLSFARKKLAPPDILQGLESVSRILNDKALSQACTRLIFVGQPALCDEDFAEFLDLASRVLE